MIAYLIKYHGMTAEDAHAYVKSYRPQIKLGKKQWNQAVKAYETKVHEDFKKASSREIEVLVESFGKQALKSSRHQPKTPRNSVILACSMIKHGNKSADEIFKVVSFPKSDKVLIEAYETFLKNKNALALDKPPTGELTAEFQLPPKQSETPEARQKQLEKLFGEYPTS